MRVPRSFGIFCLSVTLCFWLAAVPVPIFSVLRRADFPSGVDPWILEVAWATFKQAGWSTLISAAIGLPLGLGVGSALSRNPGGKSWLLSFLAFPFGVPALVASMAWILILGRSGILSGWGFSTNIIYSLKAVILAHVFFNAPWIALWVAEARRRISESMFLAGRSLGAGPLRSFQCIAWPIVRAPFLIGMAQSFSFCSMSFALVLILGGGPPVQTLETALYSKIRYGTLDLSGAAQCGIMEALMTVVPWGAAIWLQNRFERKLGGTAIRSDETAHRTGRAAGGRILTICMGVFCVLFSMPYLATFIGVGQNISQALSEAIPALKVSLGLSALVAAGSLVVAIFCLISLHFLGVNSKASSFFSVLIVLPAGISALVLGLGFWLSYSRWIDPFEGSLIAMAWVQITLFSPVVFRVLWPIARRCQVGLLHAAHSLGAGPWRAFLYVEWPRWRGQLITSFMLVFAASLGEVVATGLFYSENIIPLPLLISRWMARYRFEEATALCCLLLILSAGVFALMALGEANVET